MEEFIREEYAEAVAYEGGPVEGVEIAEEVNPTFVPQPAEVKVWYTLRITLPFLRASPAKPSSR